MFDKGVIQSDEVARGGAGVVTFDLTAIIHDFRFGNAGEFPEHRNL